MSATRNLRTNNDRTTHWARRATPGQGHFDGTQAAPSSGPSYREDYMHGDAQNIDEWLSETGGDAQAIMPRAKH